VPAGKQVADADLPGLLEDFDARQLLHVTFGSILDEFGVRFHEFMTRHETDYQTVLGAHFKRHLKPFAGKVVD
jgi:hypothetical protein